MKISFSKSLNSNIDLLLCPVFKDFKADKNYNENIKKIYSVLLNDKLLSGEKGESEIIISNEKNLPKKICFVGFGEAGKLQNFDVREIISAKMKSLMDKHNKKIGLYVVPELEKFITELIEGVLLVNFTSAKFKTGKDDQKAKEVLFDELIILNTNETKYIKQADEALLAAKAVNDVRDLVNGPPNFVNVEVFTEKAKKIAKENGYKISVFDKKDLEKMKMGAILAVNRGSGPKGSAKMVVLDYTPKGISKDLNNKPILLVGKGIIFDSGGYNLKPYKGIEDMHQDKAGGAVVMGVFMLLKKLNIKRRVIGIVPLTENLIDAEALKPSEVITSYSGKTIEIRNTDAEGRLILADSLSYGIQQFKPEYTIDIATLTGACIIALGDRYAAIMGNDRKLINSLLKAGEDTDELLWEMPMHREFKEIIKGKVADVRNADDGTAYLAGTMKAAAFLENFIDESKWAHIDIAGVTYVDRPKPYDYPMATGFGLRMLIKFLEKT